MDSDQISYHIIVTGRVQGVAFRYNTKIKADELGLGGNVKNLENGTVEIYVTGAQQEIIQFLDWCQSGPPAALVNRLDYNSIEIFVENGFNIIR